MNKTLLAICGIYINTYFDALVAARDRVQAVDTGDTMLSESQRIRILAATGATSIDELIDGAKVVKKLERSALIQVHDLLFLSGRYGVMTCMVPAIFVVGPQFSMQQVPSLPFCDQVEILDRLGVTSDRFDAFERVYDYSTCVETPVAWLPVRK